MCTNKRPQIARSAQTRTHSVYCQRGVEKTANLHVYEAGIREYYGFFSLKIIIIQILKLNNQFLKIVGKIIFIVD